MAYCGLGCGLESPQALEQPAFAAQNPVSDQQKEVDSSVATTEFHRTNVEFGKHWSLSALA